MIRIFDHLQATSTEEGRACTLEASEEEVIPLSFGKRAATNEMSIDMRMRSCQM